MFWLSISDDHTHDIKWVMSEAMKHWSKALLTLYSIQDRCNDHCSPTCPYTKVWTTTTLKNQDVFRVALAVCRVLEKVHLNVDTIFEVLKYVSRVEQPVRIYHSIDINTFNSFILWVLVIRRMLIILLLSDHHTIKCMNSIANCSGGGGGGAVHHCPPATTNERYVDMVLGFVTLSVCGFASDFATVHKFITCP